jgi:hypothetical protein
MTDGQVAPAVQAQRQLSTGAGVGNGAQQPAANETVVTERSESGKIKQAAREGLSSLGDSTAGLVRGAIATALYWVPGVIVGLGLAWWWRKRRLAAVSEPPPK